MKGIIHGKLKDKPEDSIIIEGATIEELQETAKKEVKKRGWQYPWSEIIER